MGYDDKDKENQNKLKSSTEEKVKTTKFDIVNGSIKECSHFELSTRQRIPFEKRQKGRYTLEVSKFNKHVLKSAKQTVKE